MPHGEAGSNKPLTRSAHAGMLTGKKKKSKSLIIKPCVRAYGSLGWLIVAAEKITRKPFLSLCEMWLD